MMAIEIDDNDAPHGAFDLLYSFMHSSLSPVSKYRERYGQNGLQATTVVVVVGAPCSIPPTKKDRRSSTPIYSHSMCKRVFRVKLFVSSIHLCIHHHLYPNTDKDMA